MDCFVSYARQDRAAVDLLTRRLKQLGHSSWVDQDLAGGTAWWEEILARIRACDAMVAVVSTAGLRSAACTAERAYARSLGKPLLPVLVEALPTETLPGDLARLHVIDYSRPSEDAAIRFAAAVAAVPAAPPLPDPLPDPPPPPMSYLVDLSERVRAPTLTLEEQLGLIGRLEGALQRAEREDEPDDARVAGDLLRELERRSDLYAQADRRLQAVLSQRHRAQSPPAATPPPPPTPAPAMPTPATSHAAVTPPASRPRSRVRRWLLIAVAVIVGLMFLGSLIESAAPPVCVTDVFGNLFCE